MSTRPHVTQPRLAPPRRRSDTIRRPRLHQPLSNALDYDVLLVSAPAGFGKSTLAVDWVDDVGLPVAWLSLDNQDRDPVALIFDLVAAVRVAFPNALHQFAKRLRAGAAPSDAGALVMEFAAAVQNEIDELFVFVMDDFHALDDAQEALEVVDTLIRGVPLSMRIHVLSRSWPTLPSLARMVAQRKGLSLTVEDLLFTDEEAVELLQRSGVRDGESQSALIERADGWAAALAILADHYGTSHAGRGTDATSEFILSDFVEQEVLTRLADPSAQLLRACAVFPSFDVSLAEELSGDPNARSLLRELERTNHLIVRLQDGDWFRMHALLREHVLDRLAREEPERLRALRRSAAALYVRRGMRREAIQISLDAGDWPEAVRELHELREELYQRGERATLADWLDQLPADVIESAPDLLMTRARLSIKAFDGQTGLVRLDLLDDRRLTVEQQARRQLYRSVALRQVGRLPDAIEACRWARAIALEGLADDSPLFAEIDLEEAIALGMSGQFDAARERFETAVDAFERIGDHHRAAEAHDGFGVTLALQGSLAEAMREFTAAQRLWRVLGEPSAQIATMNKFGNVQHDLGELETARETFNVLVQRARDVGDRRMEAYGHEGLATVERDMGHLEAAKSLYGLAMQETQEFDDPTLVADVTFGLAMTYREGGDFRRASTLLEHGAALCGAGGHAAAPNALPPLGSARRC